MHILHNDNCFGKNNSKNGICHDTVLAFIHYVTIKLLMKLSRYFACDISASLLGKQNNVSPFRMHLSSLKF